MATAPRVCLIAIRMPIGSATPSAFRNAIQVLILLVSSRVMVRQRAVMGRGSGVSANAEYKIYIQADSPTKRLKRPLRSRARDRAGNVNGRTRSRPESIPVPAEAKGLHV